MILTISKADIPIIVHIHLISFNNFFLSFLGYFFLKELYENLVSDSSGITYKYVENEHVLGFVVGTECPNGLYERLLRKRWWRFGLATVPAFIRKPSILPRLVRALHMHRQVLPMDNCGTLMSIAVDPTMQCLGYGKKLLHAFFVEAQKRGLEYINLTTDADNNDKVNAFYLSQGFSLHQCYSTPEGRRMNEYLYMLANLNSSNE